MIGRTSTVDTVRSSAQSGKDLAARLAQDRKFRKQLLAAVGHGAAAKRRASSRMGLVGAALRLATDVELRSELDQMAQEVRHAWSRVEAKRSHRLRTTVLVVAAAGAVAVLAPKLKALVSGPDDGAGADVPQS
jgi:siroheme synthase (precorrin-2 oxidase/ferrochelatase)